MQLSNQLYHKKILGNTDAGMDSSTVAGDAIDVVAVGTFDRARLIIELGAVTSTANIAAGLQECDTAAGTYSVIANLGDDGLVATDQSDTTIILDVPLTKRYLQYTYKRTVANIEFDSLTVQLYSSGKIPVAQSATVWKEIVK